MRKILLVIFAGISVWAFSPSALVNDARAQIGVTLRYDPSYSRIDYPMGDVAAEKGVCSDVVVRALRAQGIDLQRLIHEDMRANFAAYPRRWGAKTTDRNIDVGSGRRANSYRHRKRSPKRRYAANHPQHRARDAGGGYFAQI